MKSETMQEDDDEPTRSAEGENSKELADGDDSDNDYETTNVQSTGKSQYKKDKEKNVQEIKEMLAKLDEEFPALKEFSQKESSKVPVVMKGKQERGQKVVIRQSQRNQDKIA